MIEYFSKEKVGEEGRYNLDDFIFRWKKLQRVIQKENLDGLLLITGQDSSDSVYSAYLFNWLFLGLSGVSIYTNQYLDPIYSQMVIAITKQKSYIFITPQARQKLQGIIYAIPNCKIISPTPSQYTNKQLLDILKITTFYQSTQSLKKIGIFLQQADSPKTIIEKWPIIQSYALEPIGKTFFTLAFEVINLHSKISTLFKNLDNHSLKNLIHQTAYSLEGHFRGSTNIFQLTKIQQRQAISQLKIQQNLQQAVDIQINSSGNNQKDKVKVIFGQRTANKQNLSQSSATIQSQHSFHSNIQLFDPYTNLKVWRTFFLSTILPNTRIVKQIGVQDQNTLIVTTKYQSVNQENQTFKNCNILMELYVSLIQGVIDSISVISKDYRNLKKQFLEQSIFSKIKLAVSSIYADQTITQNNLDVQLESFDAFGQSRPIDFKDSISFKLTSTFFVIKCRLNGIMSLDKQTNLGSIIFSQSFLLQEGCFLLLTKNIPYLDFCHCQVVKNDLLQHLNPNYQFEQLGKLISEQGLKARIFIPCQKLSTYRINIPILNIKCYFHEKGIRLYGQKFGWRYIQYSKISNLTMINKIPGEWVLMQIQSPFIFSTIENNIIAFEFRGKPFQHLINRVNSKQNPLPLSFVDEIPPILGQNWYFLAEILRKDIKEGSLMYQHQILQNQFLWDFIEAKQLMIINQMKDIKFSQFKSAYQQKIQGITNKNIDKLPILVINGTYGSNKLKLAECLRKVNNTQYWIFNISSQNLYSRIEAETFVKMMGEYIQTNQIQSKDSNLLIVVVPSWMDSSQFLRIAEQHYYIKGVTSIVNASNFFESENYNLAENVISFLFPGYSQHIVIDTYGEDESLINSIMKIVWNINRQCRVLRSTNSTLTTAQCQDILTSNLYTSQYTKFLRTKYGIFYNFESLKELSVNYIEFKLPIFNLLKIKQLTKTKGYLIDENKIKEELKVKQEEAEKSEDQLMLALYKIEESLTLFKRKQKAMRIRSLRGVFRVNGEEGQVHVLWANHSYRQKIIVNDKTQLGVSILSTNYDELEIRNYLQSLTNKIQFMSALKPPRKVEELNEEEKKMIERQGRRQYLQNGQFFDGYFFRDVEGHILPSHPQIDRLLKEWVANANKEINQHNNKIKQQWKTYTQQYQ